MLVRILLCAKIEAQNGGEQSVFQWQNKRKQSLFFNKLRVYATANKWKSDQKGIFFRFMLSESSLQVGSNELFLEPSSLDCPWPILDIVLTTTPDLITTSVHHGMSDHQIVISNLDMKAKIVKKKPRKVFIHSKADLQRIKEDITVEWEDFRKSNPGNNSVERNWLKFKNLLHSVMQKWIPQRTINRKWNLPWITPAIRRLIRKTQRCYNKARKSKEDDHWRDFRNMQRMTKKVIENAHDNHVTGLLDLNEKSN